MDVDEVFLGSDHKCIKKYLMKFNDESIEKCVKCKVGEVNELLSLRKLLLQEPRYERCVTLSEAEWDNGLKLAKVTRVAKNLTKNFSHSRNKTVYLYPEECLCLMEMKCLLLTWKGRKLSIKKAFTLLLDYSNGCTFNQFRTYGYLVKLGFRVFRHDKEVQNINQTCSKDLTKQLLKTKKTNFTDNKRIKNIYDSKNKVALPNVSFSTRVIIPRPSSCLMPYNVMPKYETYSFNITVQSDGQTKITEMISHHESNNYNSQKIFTKLPIVNDLKSTGVHLVYEKNIPEIKNSANYENNDFNYVPCVKKPKLTSTKDTCLPVKSSVTISVSNNKNNLNVMPKCSEEIINTNIKSMETEKVHFPSSYNVNKFTLNNTSNSLNNETETTNQLLGEKKQLNNEEIMDYSVQTLNLSSTEKNYSNSELPKLASSTTFEDSCNNLFGNQLNIPSHIRMKLFAVKSKTFQYESTVDHNNEHQVHYDVYYPDNDVAKTTRPAPNFRVIVFENEDTDTFPNVYKVTVSIPHDNVPILWAIVNSSQVSFYNVNCIVLPKSSEWEAN